MPGDRQHIAVGVIFNSAGDKVLLSRRSPDKPHGGLWEFPGGKSHPGEDVRAALRRELDEELSVVVDEATPLLRIDHDYPGHAVTLDVWRVDAWHGEPGGREGQEIEWVALLELRDRAFPEANHAIIERLNLPQLYLITPDLPRYDDEFMGLAERLLRAGVRLLQFRSTKIPAGDLAPVVGRLSALCEGQGARLLVNSTPADALRLGAHGVHLNSARLLQLNRRPLDRAFLVGASCHGAIEIEQAERLGLDFAVAGPVRRTATHADAEPLGWMGFRRLTGRSSMPVFALGGVRPDDLGMARRCGAHGIAMISGVWSAPDPVAAVAAARGADLSVS